MAHVPVVPSWDGQPSSFERFEDELTWYIAAMKEADRRYVVARVRPHLQGTARTLVQRWKAADFDNADGPTLFLERLRASRITRRPMVDADAHMEEYFALARRQGESVVGFMNREDNKYSEFKEATMRMVREYLKRKGLKPDVFDGPVPLAEPRAPATPTQPPMTGGWARARGARARTPQADDSWEVPGESGESPPLSEAAPEEPQDDVYFAAFLEILRGWRLVKGAQLEKGEKRDLMSSTKSQWDFETVSDALQMLYGDEEQRQQGFRRRGWLQNKGLETGEWDQPLGTPQGGDSFDWSDVQAAMDVVAVQQACPTAGWPEERPNEPDPTQYTAADQQALRELNQVMEDQEVMVAGQQCSLTAAREAVATFHRDRGFGKQGGKGKGKGKDSGCYECGSKEHFMRNCPQLANAVMALFKGKGKFYRPKGKGKGKGKSSKGGKGKGQWSMAVESDAS